MALLRSLGLLVSLAVGLTACRPAASGADLAAARQLYLARGCAACHGPDGAGDGPAARATRRPPRDLRDAASFTGPRTEAAIAEVIARGIEGDRGGMPPQSFLPEHERRTLARFVLSLSKSTSSSKGL